MSYIWRHSAFRFTAVVLAFHLIGTAANHLGVVGAVLGGLAGFLLGWRTSVLLRWVNAHDDMRVSAQQTQEAIDALNEFLKTPIYVIPPIQEREQKH